MLLGAALLVLVQAGIGIAVNLFVSVPSHHPGSHPTGYLVGSYDSVAWAIAHGAGGLAVHASLGLALVVLAAGACIHAARSHRTAVTAWSVVAGLLVVGAGFNGSSFLDFADDVSSLIMALLAFAAAASYAVALFLLAGPARAAHG